MDKKEAVEMFYSILHFQLMARLPQRNGFHIYATDTLIRHVKTNFYEGGIEVIIGEGLDYARYALGFDANGEPTRTPRGPREIVNFKTVMQCIVEASRAIAEIGGVKVNGNSI